MVAPAAWLTLRGMGLDMSLSPSSLAGGKGGKDGVSTGSRLLGSTGGMLAGAKGLSALSVRLGDAALEGAAALELPDDFLASLGSLVVSLAVSLADSTGARGGRVAAAGAVGRVLTAGAGVGRTIWGWGVGNTITLPGRAA